MRLSVHSQRDRQDILTPIEPLEARRLLSAVLSVHPAALQERTGQAVALVATSGAQTRAKPVRRGKSLSLEGTAGDDIAAIDYRKNHAFFTLNGVTIQYKAPGLRTIAIDLGDGNDVLVAG